MRYFAAIACLSLLVLVSCASGGREPYTGTEPAVRDLGQFEAELRAAVAGAPGLALAEAGRVSWEGFASPIWVVHVDRPLSTKRALVFAGIHGNEPAGPAWALELVHRLAADASLYADVSFDIVPLLNPWGWSRDVRYNRDGRDINRDFATFTTQEARAFRDLVAGRRYDFSIDHHEDRGAKGFYVYQYADRDTRPTRALIAAVRDIAFPIEQDVNMVILRTRDGLIRAPRWGLWYMKATHQLGSANWVRLSGTPRVFTVETPTALALDERVRLHRTAFASLVDDVLEGGL
jgi:murein peptide amidase A